MKKNLFAVMLFLSTFSANVFAESKKDFGRDHVLIAADPAIIELLSIVVSKIDSKSLKGKPAIELHRARKALKLICVGSTSEFPDIIATTREMTGEEFKRCQNNNVGSIIKFKIGYEALVVAASKKSINLNLDTRKLFKALAADVPDPRSKHDYVLSRNPYKTWKDIDPDAPNQKIKFLAPADKSRNEDTVKLLGMEPGCRTWDWVPGMKYVQKSFRLYRELCRAPRKDGMYVKTKVAGTDLTKQLLANTDSIGLMDFNTWYKSKDKLKAYTINEMPPTIGTISKNLYPLSRPYYVYIKASSLKNVQGVAHVMNELVNKKALGIDGYLVKMGMIAMPPKELKREMEQAAEFTAMTKPDET